MHDTGWEHNKVILAIGYRRGPDIMRRLGVGSITHTALGRGIGCITIATSQLTEGSIVMTTSNDEH